MKIVSNHFFFLIWIGSVRLKKNQIIPSKNLIDPEKNPTIN